MAINILYGQGVAESTQTFTFSWANYMLSVLATAGALSCAAEHAISQRDYKA
jgi:hypothetical protein